VNRRKRFALLLALTVSAAALFGVGASAASAAPVLRIQNAANSTVEPGGTLRFFVGVENVSADPKDGSEVDLRATLPAGMTALSATDPVGIFTCTGPGGGSLAGASIVSCVGTELEPTNDPFGPIVTVAVDPTASGLLTTSFEAWGGGATLPDGEACGDPSTGPPACATSADPTMVTSAPPAFGIDAFDGQVSDPDGTPFTRAGGHPDSITSEIDTNTRLKTTFGGPGPAPWPAEPVKDILVDTPPGLVGDPNNATKCTAAELVPGSSPISPQGAPLCPPSSQVGVITLTVPPNGFGSFAWRNLAVYNMVPPPNVAARFAFIAAGHPIVIDAKARRSDYALSIDSTYISEGIPLTGVRLTLWGTPADPSHTRLRACPGNIGVECPAGVPEKPFLRLPTACTAPGTGLTTTAVADSWFNPGALNSEGSPDLSDPAWDSKSFLSHNPPDFPNPPSAWGTQIGPTDCDAVPFTPTISVAPTTNQADSPSGLDVDLTIPQDSWNDPAATSQSDLKTAKVTLPAGMSVNPASANGLSACSSAQIGLLGTNFPAPAPIRFSHAVPNCPENSKIGDVEIDTPLLDHPIKGAAYLAKQADNPFGSLLALYITATDPESGVILKLAGHVEAGAGGQLTAVFDNQPQLPFEALHLDLYGGPRGPLRTPASCGSHTTQATLSPWSGNAPVELQSSFPITAGPGGTPCPSAAFNPKLSAGTVNPLAGSFSPFTLRLTREDGSQELSGLTATLPEGLLGKLAGIPYCPEGALAAISAAEGSGAAQIASPSCPAASQVGTVVVGAGAGPSPFYVNTGKAYLAGPYKGAPLSLAIVTPAVAGPFDLGSVVVRAALQVNPSTAQITAVSDPLPTILHGIVLDLRDVRVSIDRPQFTLNPTSCDPMAIDASLSGIAGGSANLSQRFQVSSCSSLPFKPRLALRLKGGTKRTDFPALSSTLKARAGDANIDRVSVVMPPGVQVENAHIVNPCTRVQFNESACPKKSILGTARAFSPLLDEPLEGPVYFRANGGERLLPDVVADLRGQIHVVLVGAIDTVHAKTTPQLRTTFSLVPDAPVSKFRLSLYGGKRSLLVNNRNLCKSANKVRVLIDGQNGKTADQTPTLGTDCKKGAGKKKPGKR